ncbi:hypothetical protein KIH39_03165 [Telmatocola sphagniphila]|uniref:Uncharacterized protein n=1 Tax=Telmatocola sphagniphila TaxID=1123043 RepID=A0A8E6EVQ9_9BACT|nr:hypothetical protein [Telmatocola sphagniphila]QVL32932.1 hypothetical protein KIH39_03165 [Telmatocola sphagniphila]
MESLSLARKISLLVEERGWNQEDFARIAQINRHTARQILKDPEARAIRNATIAQCATALGLRVNELRDLPLERLLPRMHGQVHADEQALKQLREQATLPELKDWLSHHPDRMERLTRAEVKELLEMQEVGGLLQQQGVENCIRRMERRREILDKVGFIAKGEQLDLLEQIVNLLYEKAIGK